ncbi:MAG: di-trans,poly-cis-decaprenylcistransferase [Oscillospiraceae bacterium]|nr:di-trans,poly-cis-decaprenylcistransferase [Oscillospiraceae bacterium]
MKEKDAEKALPVHVGLIMDGNGRWAKRRGLPRSFGHKKGADTFTKAVEWFGNRGVKYLTVYAFSTENWKRPKEEIDGIMNLLDEYLDKADNNVEKNIKTVFIGDRERLDKNLQNKMRHLEEETSGCTGITAILAINYGGRDEIVRAVREIAKEAKYGKVNEITEEYIGNKLYTAGIPDPDVIARPSGEQRLSNFLLWQSAYSEFIFMDTLWPDFSEKDVDYILDEYAKRNRRFGAL